MPFRRRHTGLAAAELGVPLRVAAVGVTGPERLRLAELGLRPGAVVTVLARLSGGGRLVGLGSGRIAVDPRTARALSVQVV